MYLIDKLKIIITLEVENGTSKNLDFHDNNLRYDVKSILRIGNGDKRQIDIEIKYKAM